MPRSVSKGAGSAAIIVASALFASIASAVPITRHFEFSGTDFGPLAPIDPIDLSFSLTFDPDGPEVIDETAGLVLNSLSIPVDSTIAYSYFPTTDNILLGGLQTGLGGLSAGHDDFRFRITDASGSASPFRFEYSTAALGDPLFNSAGDMSLEFRDAAPVTRTFEFEALGFSPSAPVAQVNGRFTVTLDPAGFSVLDATDGLIIDALSLPVDSTIAYSYFPSTDNFLLGGLASGLGGLSGGRDDFRFRIVEATGAASPSRFEYSSATPGGPLFNIASDISLRILPVPEPSSLSLLGLALASFVVGPGRRRARRLVFDHQPD